MAKRTGFINLNSFLRVGQYYDYVYSNVQHVLYKKKTKTIAVPRSVFNAAAACDSVQGVML